MRRHQRVGTGSLSSPTACPIKICVKARAGDEIAPPTRVTAAPKPQKPDRRQGRPGRQRDPRIAPQPERQRARHSVAASLRPHRRDVLPNHIARQHEEQIDADAERRRRQAESQRAIEAVDQPDMRTNDRQNRKPPQLVDRAVSPRSKKLPRARPLPLSKKILPTENISRQIILNCNIIKQPASSEAS